MFTALARSLTAPGRRACTVAAVIGLVLVGWLPTRASLPALCGALSRVPVQEWPAALGPVSPSGLLLGWAVMLVAMMAPLFADPLRHVWFASLPSRRVWAVALCAAGYLAVWMAVAPAILLVSWILLASLPTVAALLFALAVAVAWSASPVSQRARNACHRFLRVGARGRRADAECLRQGLHSGAVCVAACWPWMVVPMLVGGGAHGVAMVGVSLWLALERLLPSRTPHWQWPPAVSLLLWRWRLMAARPRGQNV